MNQQEKCSRLEEQSLSTADCREWEAHAAACEYCRDRIHLFKLLEDDSKAISIRLGGNRMAAFETALAKRPAGGKLMLLRLSYAAQFIVVAAAMMLIIHYSTSLHAKKSQSVNKEILSWDSKISAQDISRKINGIIKGNPGKTTDPISKQTESLRRRMNELRKSIDKV